MADIESIVSEYITADRNKKTFDEKMKKLRDPLVEHFKTSGDKKVTVSNGSLTGVYVKSEDFNQEKLAKLHPGVWESCSDIHITIPATVHPDDLKQIQEVVSKFVNLLDINRTLNPQVLKNKLELQEINFSEIEDCFEVVKEYWQLRVGK